MSSSSEARRPTFGMSQVKQEEPKEAFPELGKPAEKKVESKKDTPKDADEEVDEKEKEARKEAALRKKEARLERERQEAEELRQAEERRVEERRAREEAARAEEEEKKALLAQKESKYDEAVSKIVADGSAVDGMTDLPPSELVAKGYLDKHGLDLKWIPTEEGKTLAKVAGEDVEAQMMIIFAFQSHFSSKGKEGMAVVSTAMKSLFLEEVVSYEAFQQWRDDEAHDEEEFPGKVETLVKCNEFIEFLESLDDEDDEEDEEEEEG